MSETSYSRYVSDTTLHDKYAAYQQRYADQLRESDRVLIELIVAAADRITDRSARVLDIGCHTGNLLAHLKAARPEFELVGGDLVIDVIEGCRNDQRLAGIRFEVLDMLDLLAEEPFDVVVANAVAQYFNLDEWEQAIASVARTLRAGGTYVAFEWLHPFAQVLEIRETSRSHPDGLTIHSRPYDVVEPILRRHGFAEVEFMPFEIPIDLERGATFSDNRSGFEDLNSYTVRTDEGRRLIFRGALLQPWCHLVAQMGG